MKYFKNIELAKLYHVSEKTVRNWIEAAQNGKLELQLHTEDDRIYIANTSKNTLAIERLVEKGRKFKNSRGHKIVKPPLKFYSHFSEKQILDIVSNLDIHREIPRQYNYMDGGAHSWDKYTHRLQKEEGGNILKKTIQLVDENAQAIDRLLNGCKKVNIIDLGVGNALPVRATLSRLLDKNILNRYIAIDISSEMLHIAQHNIEEWFDGKVNFEGYARDFAYDRFDDLLVNDMLRKDADTTINLVLMLGGTLSNFRSQYDVLKVVYSSMGRRDLLVYTDKTDAEATRRYFDFHTNPGVISLSPIHRFIFDSLDIDESFYEVEMGYDSRHRERYVRIKLKVAITIELKTNGIERKVDLNKGDTILLWRAKHLTPLEIITQFKNAGLTLLQASTTKDRQYLLTISGIDADPSSV